MNGYDFDKTIYHEDCTVQFTLWRLKRSLPAWGMLPRVGLAALRMKKTGKERFKEQLHLLWTAGGADLHAEVERFWDANMGRIHRWYLAGKRTDDVVISASPLFLVRPAMQRLGVEAVFASPLNPETGLYEGRNCYGAEKVRVFQACYGPDARLEAWYSDSVSDAPMAALSDRAFLVKGEKTLPWPET